MDGRIVEVIVRAEGVGGSGLLSWGVVVLLLPGEDHTTDVEWCHDLSDVTISTESLAVDGGMSKRLVIFFASS